MDSRSAIRNLHVVGDQARDTLDLAFAAAPEVPPADRKALTDALTQTARFPC